MSRICKACGGEFPNAAHYCGNCGAKLPNTHNWLIYDRTIMKTVPKGSESDTVDATDLISRLNRLKSRDVDELNARIDSLKADIAREEKAYNKLKNSSNGWQIRDLQKEISNYRKNPLKRMWSEMEDFAVGRYPYSNSDGVRGWTVIHPMIPFMLLIMFLCL